MLIRLITFSFLLTSCLPGKFHMRTISKKKAVTEYEEKKFKLSFFDPAADKTFCPNVNVIFTSNTPEGASEYCFSDSGDPSQTCEWKSLPLNIKFKASSENQTLKKYLLFRNSEKIVLNETWESNELIVKPTTIAKTEADQIRQLKTDELTENQMDEYLCRMDEWSYNVAKNIAMNVSDSFTQDRRVDMSHQLARMYYGDYGLPVKMSKDEISKIGWRLIVHTQEPARVMFQEHSRFYGANYTQNTVFTIPSSLADFDVSFINFKGRNIQHLNFKGTNLRGEQLNEISPLSSRFSVSGLDLKNWKPATVKNIEEVDFSYSKDPPWSYINQASTLNFLNLSGLDLSNWQPSTSFTSGSRLTLSFATNIPFDRFNSMTTFSYSNVDLSYTNLSGWQPSPTVSLKNLNLKYASNVPWTYINANSHADGFWGMLLSGLDLSLWTPGTTKVISAIDYTNTKNIPWTLINANTSSEGYKGSNFDGLDLTNFAPQISSSLMFTSFKNSTNINWSVINANSHADGFNCVNFNGLDLKNWNPNTTRAIGPSLVGSVNIPWDNINANSSTTSAGMDFSGQDLSKWNPSSGISLQGINFEGSVNIPWEKLNLNTNSIGFRLVNFTGVDLTNWAPQIPKNFQFLNLTNAKNIPWNLYNSNTDANSYLGNNFSNLDLTNWVPRDNISGAQIILSKNKNIPWNSLNANTIGFTSAFFDRIDLTSFNPSSIVNQNIIFNKIRNINWSKILNTSSGSTNHNFSNVHTIIDTNNQLYYFTPNLEGFVPKHGYTITPPYGARSVQDFEEAAETSGYRGVKWGLDNSYPWGF